MLLVIHAGTHKTGSTYFQSLLHNNRDPIRKTEVYCEADPTMVANHATAWTCLGGNMGQLRAHLVAARDARKRAALLSSEDFEGIIFEPQRAVMVEQATASLGFDDVEWHVVLRRPGGYLASIFAEMSRHGFVAFPDFFVAAIRDGAARVDRPAGRFPRQWRFCFDPATHLRAFANSTTGTTIVHDFDDQVPFPGHAIADRLQLMSCLQNTASEKARNRRAAHDTIEDNLRAALTDAVVGTGMPEDIIGRLAAQAAVGPDTLTAASAALNARYEPGFRAILAEHRLASPLAQFRKK